MRSYWFSSDLHLCHPNVIQYCNRPFSNIQEMEQTIITNFNKVIKKDDILYLLGDICLGKKENWVNFLNSLVCTNIIIIQGNHDATSKIPKDLVLAIFEVARLKMYGKVFMLSHYPYRAGFWRTIFKRLNPAVREKRRPIDNGLWLLHGHTHGKTKLCDYHPRMLNVGVDANNFYPISGGDIISIIQRQKSCLKN
jgi:calcineurin-like phosphoesterase family protein